uniref:Uncharacterized protein n=1 Tax=Arundo donax TaxID=35708 RepID=A0A0A9ABP4_ARUDO
MWSKIRIYWLHNRKCKCYCTNSSMS